MKKFDFNKVGSIVKFTYHITMIVSCIGGVIMWFRWWRDYKKYLSIAEKAFDTCSANDKWDLPDIEDNEVDLVEEWEKSPENKWGFTRSDLVNGVRIVYDKEDDDELY